LPRFDVASGAPRGDAPRLLIVPGLHDSGPAHWQSWLADRLQSGGLALAINGAATMAGALLAAAIAPSWPFWAIALACAAFGASAMGWNGVYIATVARQAPSGSIGLATGGSLSVTYAGVIVMPPILAALHDRAGWSYGAIFAFSGTAAMLGIACVLAARRAARTGQDSR